MKQILLFLITLSGNASGVFSQLPAVTSGQLIRHAGFSSAYVSPRNIDVWLPPDYDRSKTYPAIYMNDGQMLFDSSITWNKKEWGVDEVAGQLIGSRKIKPFIVIGIWNGGADRHREYLPQKPFNDLSAAERMSLLSSARNEGTPVFNKDTILSDNYLRFIVNELMPFIRKNYQVSKRRKDNYIMGSSMGGLISLYAVCEYPGTFGGAACLSTHWPGIFSSRKNPFPAYLFRYISKNIPAPRHHKFYFDRGTETLDSMYQSYQEEADSIFIKKGYAGELFMSRIFQGAAHDENAWRNRMDLPLLFLLGDSKKAE